MRSDATEVELRARVAELEEQLHGAESSEMEELRETLRLYIEENKRLQAQNRRTSAGTSGGVIKGRGEVVRLQAQIDDLTKANSRLQHSVTYKEKQLTSANAAAAWAHTQLAGVVNQIQTLTSEVEVVSGNKTPGKKSSRARSPSPASRSSGGNGDSNSTQKALSVLCDLISAADQGMKLLSKKLVGLDVDGRVRDLENQVRQWRNSAERQRGEVENMEAENRELRERLQNGGAVVQPKEATRIISPEIIRMPSHASHSVNADHWPIRSVACQTPRGDEQWVWGLSGSNAEVTKSPGSRRSANTATWEAPSYNTPPVSPMMWDSPSQSYDSPSRSRRARSPGASPGNRRSNTSRGLVSPAVLKRLGSKSPFRGSAYA
eukprot:TRINITY_DN30893_c0_g1_i1.p1 TRINITY_DN30893_c0_g1~~TRINITY_DN30893_c0_g1_i1.p1  ORF type:complete len:377 (+),score=78.90 TRINITY_DN30893_c0_g1_i1:38-1168(+)